MLAPRGHRAFYIVPTYVSAKGGRFMPATVSRSCLFYVSSAALKELVSGFDYRLYMRFVVSPRDTRYDSDSDSLCFV